MSYMEDLVFVVVGVNHQTQKLRDIDEPIEVAVRIWIFDFASVLLLLT